MSQKLRQLENWVQSVQSGPHLIYAKYLSANDTGATGAHQAGPYMPKSMIFDLFPSVHRSDLADPRARFTVRIASHPGMGLLEPTAIWYNNKLRGGTRNETRVTGWGGANCPLLEPSNTGSMAIFAFARPQAGDTQSGSVWVTDSAEELEYLEEAFGAIDPGRPLIIGLRQVKLDLTPRALRLNDLPAGWQIQLPTGAELVEWVMARTRHLRTISADERLMKRRDLEYEAFRLLEAAVVLPTIQKGFQDVNSFIQFANSVANRRKSRAGTSLELHLAAIFEEEGLGFAAQATTEGNKTPDFLFPSVAAYANPAFPTDRLRMLGVKTTLKDRWRQILNEADRLRNRRKHLFTLQEGVSVAQHQEMADDQVVLVVPAALHAKYPPAVRPHLLDLSQFIEETKRLTAN